MSTKREVPERRRPGARAVNALDIVESTADAAFATDENGRIVIWNRAAEHLLGRVAGSVLGKPCHEIVCGADLFGNRFCDEDCSLTRMVRRGEPIRAFPLLMRHAQGYSMSVICSTLTVRGPRASQFSLIHLLQPAAGKGAVEADQLHALLLAGAGLVSREKPADGLAASGASQDAPGTDGNRPPGGSTIPGGTPAGSEIPLSTREVEVLKLVSCGSTASQIADALFISVTTVRTHIRNILHKLDAHSKVQAVSLALRNRLI
ncbi:MAG: LuxR C-terminal-related transcriptional regulator [Acidobacteriota bacterium]